MANMKSLDRISQKWLRVSSTAQTEYEEGVKNPRNDWATATKNAATSYNQAITEAISKKRFENGVAKAGTAKWQTNAVNKGPARWQQGIGLSEQNYVDGFSPYAAVIKNIVLPVRGAKGDPKNLLRVAAVANALHAEKLKRLGG